MHNCDEGGGGRVRGRGAFGGGENDDGCGVDLAVGGGERGG